MYTENLQMRKKVCFNLISLFGFFLIFFLKVVRDLSEISIIDLNVVDFAELTWDEQIELMTRTDILIGFHGAGLTQLLYLPDHSVVYEISCGSYLSRVHFIDIANWIGHIYVPDTSCSVTGRLDDVTLHNTALLASNIKQIAQDMIKSRK